MTITKEMTERLGVSTTTVLPCCTPAQPVNLATPANAEQRPLQPAAARGQLRARRRAISMTIMVVIPTVGEHFFTDLLQGIEETAQQQGYWVIRVSSRSISSSQPVALNPDLVKHVDGILLLGAALSPEGGAAENIVGSGTVPQKNWPPLVMINEFIPQWQLPTVHTDDLTAAFDAVTYLRQLGHRRIACIAGPSGTAVSQYRTQGYLQGLRRAGLVPEPRWVLNGDLSMAGGAQALAHLMTQTLTPTALFCHNDLLALGALHQARQLGMSVPTELSIMGFGNISLASYSTPPLTTVAQPHYEIGRQAALLLFEILSTRPLTVRSKLLDSQLVIRATTAPPLAPAFATSTRQRHTI